MYQDFEVIIFNVKYMLAYSSNVNKIYNAYYRGWKSINESIRIRILRVERVHLTSNI